MNLFFDTESTGLPKNYKAPISDVDNYPRLVQLGYVITENGNIVHQNEDIIKPNGFDIPEEASDVHGITTEIALRDGADIVDVLDEFQFWVEQCDTVIGHNVSFDINVVGAEYFRMYGKSPLEGKRSVCTMLSGIELCQLPGKFPGKLKYPKLQELYSAIFQKPMEQTHTALDDISHTVECYQAMVERGIIK